MTTKWCFGAKRNYDAEQTVADLEKLVATGDSIWSSYPYERYVFMIHATSGAGGATEHKNSTVIQRPRYSFASRDDYLSFMSTASHEFVHTEREALIDQTVWCLTTTKKRTIQIYSG